MSVDRDAIRIGADRMAGAISALVRRGIIDARSPAADAMLDYATTRYGSAIDAVGQVDKRYREIITQLSRHGGQEHCRHRIAGGDCRDCINEPFCAVCNAHQKFNAGVCVHCGNPKHHSGSD